MCCQAPIKAPKDERIKDQAIRALEDDIPLEDFVENAQRSRHSRTLKDTQRNSMTLNNIQ